MSTPLVNLFLAALVLAVLQTLAAIPWVSTFDGRPFRRWITDTTVLGCLAGGTIALAAVLTWQMSSLGDTGEIEQYGRYYGSLFHLQLVFDFVVLAPQLLLMLWP